MDQVLSTHDREDQAVRAMHRAAQKLKQIHQQKRFGVYVEKRRGSFWLLMKDRERT